MADPVGTALGLAALPTTCLQVWDFVDICRAHTTNSSLLRIKLDIQRIIFVMCGRKMGLRADGLGNAQNQGRGLDDPFIAPTVRANLNHIKRLFSDKDTMVGSYGFPVTEKPSKRKSWRHTAEKSSASSRKN